MKIQIPIVCPYCRRSFLAQVDGARSVPPVRCPACGNTIHARDPSISVVADRLLFRSRAEIDGGDPTVSIICSAAAAEAALTQVFVKWKGIDHHALEPSAAQREEWESEYMNATRRDKSKRSGFEKCADFVSKYLTGKSFDDFASDFVEQADVAKLTGAASPTAK
jgi:hypothetical protein